MREFPPFRLDTVNQCLWRREDTRDERISLTPKACSVLHYLVEHAGRLVTQDELLDALWPDTFVQPEVLKSHIMEVRSALGDSAKNPRFIETLPRRGYQFIAPVRDPAAHVEVAVELPSRKLVGRHAALADLRNCLERSLQSHRQVVFITGEPGIGKTTLADEFLRRAADFPGTRIARGQCVEGYGGTEAYYPMLEALGQLCGGPEGEAVVQALSAQAPTWLVQFPALIKREQRETLQREILGATKERMLREIGEALDAISSEKPLLLVLEDLHWVDHSTVDVISALARRRAPGKLMLVGTYRPVDLTVSGNPLKAVKQDLLIHHLCREIALEPLEPDEVAEYPAAESRGFAVPEGLAGLIYRHSEGNPLFMVAALDHMCERGLIALENGAWQVKVPLEKIDLEAPESLRQMIELQIERLSFEERRVLEAASVGKLPLSVAIAAAVSNLEVETVEELLETLAKRHQVIRSAGFRDYKTGPSPCYEFVHVLYREVLYQRIGPARKRKLHHSLAENAEALHVPSEADVAAELAYQFEQGGDWPRSVKYLLSAADTAGRRFEPRQAAEILEHALELVKKLPDPDAGPETEILEKLATIYVALGDIRAIKIYEALAALADRMGLIDLQARSLLALAFFLSWESSQRGLEVFERTLQVSNMQTPMMQVRTRMSCFFWRIWAAGWNPQDAEKCRDAFLEIERSGDRSAFASHLMEYSLIQWASSEYRKAWRGIAESRKILGENAGENPYLKSAFQLGQSALPLNLMFLGEWGEALRETQDAIAMFDRNGDYYYGQGLRLFRAWVYLHAMDFSGVLEICNSALPLVADPEYRPAPEYPPPYRTEYRICLALRGMAESALGNHERAHKLFAVARADIDRQMVMYDWYFRPLLEFGLTELWLAKGDLNHAQAQAERFLKIALATEEHTWQTLACEVNARVAMAESDVTKARDYIARGLSAMEGFEVPLAGWRVHATACELYQALGERSLADRHLALSCDTLMKLANSLPPGEPLRQIFLSAPMVRKILGRGETSHL